MLPRECVLAEIMSKVTMYVLLAGMVTFTPYLPAHATENVAVAVGQPSFPRHIRAARDCPADIDRVADSGLTKLQKAAAEGDLAEVRHLVKDCGASLDIHGYNGKGSALHEAAYYSRPEVISFLLASGANADMRKTNGGVGWTAMHMAILGPTPIPTIKALLDGGARSDLKLPDNGFTVAQLAVNQGKPEVKEFLETYKPAQIKDGDMDCIQKAMKRVTSEEIIQIHRNARPYQSLLKLLNRLFTTCGLQRLVSSP